MLDIEIKKSLLSVSTFYDQRKVGNLGPLGFRRSTDLAKMAACLDELIDQDILIPGRSLFLDMGCADGRVNVLFSYLVKRSVGIEIDEWTLDEYAPMKAELETALKEENLLLPPDNISLFHGDSMDSALYGLIDQQTSVEFEEFDLFYTYLTMQEEFAGLIAQKARKGAVFMVYGLEGIMPAFQGLRLLTTGGPMQGILAIYQKQ